MIDNRLLRLKKAVAYLKGEQIIEKQKDLSLRLGVTVNTISKALNGDEKYLNRQFFKEV